MRVGMGYDVHKLVEGRDLIVGGVKIPHTLGLLGHSDADVLLHAIMDALLGIIAQKPKMRPHIEQMEKNIAEALHIDVSQVNVKATTEEGLGFTGTEEGISSQAICALTTFYEASMAVADSESQCAGCKGCRKE